MSFKSYNERYFVSENGFNQGMDCNAKECTYLNDYMNSMVAMVSVDSSNLLFSVPRGPAFRPGPPGLKLVHRLHVTKLPVVHPLAGGTSGRMRFAFQFSTGYQHGPTHTQRAGCE